MVPGTNNLNRATPSAQDTLAAALTRRNTRTTGDLQRSSQQFPRQQLGTNRSAHLLSSNDPEALHLLAQAYYDRRQWGKAIHMCQQALRVHPTAYTFKLLGSALWSVNYGAAAEQSYYQALRLQPRYAEVYCNLGGLYAQQQDWSRAIAAFRRALRLKPDFAGAYRNFAKVWERGGAIS